MGHHRKHSPATRALNELKQTGNQQAPQPVSPDPEVSARPERRSYTADYKLKILREADACREAGEVGAILRREGLYYSHLTVWRRARDLEGLAALAPKPRGRKAKLDPQQREILRLQKQLQRTQRDLTQAQAIIAIQKKVSELLGIQLAAPEFSEMEEDLEEQED